MRALSSIRQDIENNAALLEKIENNSVANCYMSNDDCKEYLSEYELNTVEDYKVLVSRLREIEEGKNRYIVRYLCRTDLFFLLWHVCNRPDVGKQWLLERCKEVQESPNNHLDLWAREHYKSTIITFAKTIQDILASHGKDALENWNGIEPTFGIFSCTRPIAKGFLNQIKRELESNQLLIDLFPDVLWDNPQRDAPKWAENEGIIVRRRSNPKEATVEAWGVVESQPTSKHFTVCIYDDMVTEDFIRSPEMIEKTTKSWELSISLGSEYGFRRYIGTRYHFNDTYKTMIKRQSVTVRTHVATDDGTADGNPVLLSKEGLRNKRRDMGVYTFSCQMLMNPVADEAQGFKENWIHYHNGSDGSGLNIYIMIDPANEKKPGSDYTAISVVGLGADKNFYTLDMIRDRLNLTERWEKLLALHKKWRPLKVGYEKYGLQADIHYMKEKMDKINYHFEIDELGGKISKKDRIRRLVPVFEDGRWYLPKSCNKVNYEGQLTDLTESFVNEEYLMFPVSLHDDMLDAKSRIFDVDIEWPLEEQDPYESERIPSGWC